MKERRGNINWRRGYILAAIQDLALSMVSSLLAILLVIWVVGPVSVSSALFWRWLGLGLAGTAVGRLACFPRRETLLLRGYRPLVRLLGAVSVKEAVMAGGLLAGLVSLPSTGAGALAVILDYLLTADVLALTRYVPGARRLRRHATGGQPGVKTALVLGTNEESVSLAAEAEALGRYKVIGHLTADRDREGTVVGGRPVYWVQDSYDLNMLMWRLRGVDNILVPREWDAAFKGAPKPQEPPVFREESWKKYMMMLNMERKS